MAHKKSACGQGVIHSGEDRPRVLQKRLNGVWKTDACGITLRGPLQYFTSDIRTLVCTRRQYWPTQPALPVQSDSKWSSCIWDSNDASPWSEVQSLIWLLLIEFWYHYWCHYLLASANKTRKYDCTLVVREGQKFPSLPTHCLNYSKWASSCFKWAQSHPWNCLCNLKILSRYL
jgi:hypothetical protein